MPGGHHLLCLTGTKRSDRSDECLHSRSTIILAPCHAPMGRPNSTALRMGNEAFRPRRRIGNLPMVRLLSCGGTIRRTERRDVRHHAVRGVPTVGRRAGVDYARDRGPGGGPIPQLCRQRRVVCIDRCDRATDRGAGPRQAPDVGPTGRPARRAIDSPHRSSRPSDEPFQIGVNRLTK